MDTLCELERFLFLCILAYDFKGISIFSKSSDSTGHTDLLARAPAYGCFFDLLCLHDLPPLAEYSDSLNDCCCIKFVDCDRKELLCYLCFCYCNISSHICHHPTLVQLHPTNSRGSQFHLYWRMHNTTFGTRNKVAGAVYPHLNRLCLCRCQNVVE